MKFRDLELSYANAILKIDGVEYNVKAKSYGDSIAFTELEGASQMSVGRTAGQYTTDESTLEMYISDFAELVDKFGEEFYTKTFTVTNTYEKIGDTKATIDTLVACRFTKRTANDSSGGDALTRSVTVKPVAILWNGKNPIKNMPTGLK